jgi:hypothetical protein
MKFDKEKLFAWLEAEAERYAEMAKKDRKFGEMMRNIGTGEAYDRAAGFVRRGEFDSKEGAK